MGSFSNELENDLIDHVLKTAPMTAITDLFVALSTADPLDDGSGLAEPAGGSYARVNFNTWNAAAARVTTNNGVVTFPTATGAWGTITHWAIFTASSGGTMIAHGALTAPKVVGVGDTASFADDALSISFTTGGISDFLANELLDHVFNNGAYTVPTNLFVALATAVIDDDDTGSTITEPAGGDYARVNHNTWDAAAAGVSQNTGIITFPPATGAWGTVSHGAILDASSAGNLLFFGGLGASKAIGDGDTANFPDATLSVTMN